MSKTESASASFPRRTKSPIPKKRKKYLFEPSEADYAACPRAETFWHDPQPKRLRALTLDGELWFSAKDALLLAGFAAERPQNYVDADEWRLERFIDQDDYGRDIVREAVLVSLLGLHELLLRMRSERAEAVWLWIKHLVARRAEEAAALAKPLVPAENMEAAA